MSNQSFEVYEIPNTFTRDLSLDQQIELGICDWQVDIGDLSYFGRNKAEALTNAGVQNG